MNNKFVYIEWKSIFNPWKELRQLREYVKSMREADITADRNALNLYAENQELRKYKELADGRMERFVSIDDYNDLDRKYKAEKQKRERISDRFNKFIEASAETMP
ncbi:MAG TPA: hypothetical protein VGN15_12255 [Ktedonobacteraceae bacterium]|jgi:hypothetical protein|nr:hypothetical protein [Ktedonobacteraceae bacterium]